MNIWVEMNYDFNKTLESCADNLTGFYQGRKLYIHSFQKKKGKPRKILV